MQGLALLGTAIYQTIRNDLTLFHAICVVHLLALLGLDLISKGRYAGFGPWRLWCFAVIQILSLAAFIAFNVYLWVTAPTFGSQPVCNEDTVYVVFGVSIQATSPVFRYVTLGTLGAGALSYLLTFACIIPCVCGIWRKATREAGMSGLQSRKRDWVRSLFRWSRSTEDQSQVVRRRLSGEALLHFTLNKAAYCGFCIYLIVSLEQTIRRNNLDPQEKGWTFGQVIAIFLLLGVANELLNVVLANWDRKISRTGQELVPYRPASSNGHSAQSVC